MAKKKSVKHRRMKYPWLTLDIGDSFVIDCGWNAAQTNARLATQRYKKNFEPRQQLGERIRIYRVK
jgi:hypothetical protein